LAGQLFAVFLRHSFCCNPTTVKSISAMLRPTAYRSRLSVYTIAEKLSSNWCHSWRLIAASHSGKVSIRNRCSPHSRSLTTIARQTAVDISNTSTSASSKSLRRNTDEYIDVQAIDLAGWETIIGLEIHAQLKTKRKLFSCMHTQYIPAFALSAEK
jgi:hypothetical protein